MKQNHEQRLDKAVYRLTTYGQYLTYHGPGSYGNASIARPGSYRDASIALDLKLLLRELEDLRNALIEHRCAIMDYPDRMTLR